MMRVLAAASSRVRHMLRLGGPRRFNCDRQDDPAWDERAEQAVRLALRALRALPPTPRVQVGDLGAGNKRLRRVLERRLHAQFDYYAYDLHPQAPDVQRLDVHDELPDRPLDVTFCLGLLEYLRDLDDFVARLRTITKVAVVSYVVTDAPASVSPRERRQRGWLSDHARQDIESIFLRHGYTQVGFAPTHAGSTGVWAWEV